MPPLGTYLRRWFIHFGREDKEADAFQFDVAVALPLVGNVVRYRGRLRTCGEPIEGGGLSDGCLTATEPA